MRISRRAMMARAGMAAAGVKLSGLNSLRAMGQVVGASATGAPRPIAAGPFQPTWESLKTQRIPDWFRDAKFGIWAHWSAQCVPEHGDWYARRMYMQADDCYNFHVERYGHPSKFGFMEIDNLWKADHWSPEELMQLYSKAGAKYFMALANHHDNFDCFDSKHHAWNSTKIGPKRDIVGMWRKVVREHGLKFAVSNHSAHTWHWFQTAYDYDAVGPMAGKRYDAYTLTKADGVGKWWDGLDPQELYGGRHLVAPDGLDAKGLKLQEDSTTKGWPEYPPANDPAYVEKWFLRCKDLMDSYEPDLVYFDDTELPLGQAGLDVAAHYYNRSIAKHGKLEAVITAKQFTPEHLGATVLDIERGRAEGILAEPWQTDTCLGDWHYDRRIYERRGYKTAKAVIQTLVDIVSKNGNLMLNVPVRGDGSIDEEEHSIVESIGEWMQMHGEGIYGTRPFTIFGEGAAVVSGPQMFNESKARALDASDIRFTKKGDTLYAFVMGWPADGKLTIRSLGKSKNLLPRGVKHVNMLGESSSLKFDYTQEALVIRLPEQAPHELGAYGFKIRN